VRPTRQAGVHPGSRPRRAFIANYAGWTSTIYAKAGRQHRVAANGTVKVTEDDLKPPLAASYGRKLVTA
jgi:hypothetical protein